MKKKTKVLSVLALALVIGGMTNFVGKSLIAIDPPNSKPLNAISYNLVAIDPPNSKPSLVFPVKNHIMIDPPNTKPSI